MGAFPTSPRAAFLEWCSAHASAWTNVDTQIGLSEVQAQDFKTLVNSAQAAVGAQEQARAAQQAATENVNNKVGQVRRDLNELLRVIRTFAQVQGDPNVYVLAQIPAPATPSVAPPPAQPTNLSVEIAPATGAITLKWKASNPAGTSGTTYVVRRKLPSETAFSFLGITGSKKFTDTTFFAGPDSVQYTVQGQRADSSGPVSDAFTINFGRAPGGGGFVVSSITSAPSGEQPAARLAA